MIPLVKVAMPAPDVLMPALQDVLYSGMLAEGEAVYAFEREAAALFGLPNALATSSGSGALHIALLLAGAGPGRTVITTSMTAEPTSTVIAQTGAQLRYADVDPDTGNLSIAAVEAALTPDTVAICVVHYAGYPADLAGLRALADEHGLALIEDCAHALGARYGGQPIGTMGDAAIFSFQAIKHMTTVDGGLLTMRDGGRLDEARRLRWFGMQKGVERTKVDIERPGFKYNMSNVTAAIGRVQLTGIEPLIAAHIDNGRFFDAALAPVPGLRPSPLVAGAEPSYWLYTLLADDAAGVIDAMADIGVAASKLHRPNHYHSAFRDCAGPLPGLDRFYDRLVHVPCGWWVDEPTRTRIVERLRAG